jgi:hypothetical protein
MLSVQSQKPGTSSKNLVPFSSSISRCGERGRAWDSFGGELDGVTPDTKSIVSFANN